MSLFSARSETYLSQFFYKERILLVGGGLQFFKDERSFHVCVNPKVKHMYEKRPGMGRWRFCLKKINLQKGEFYIHFVVSFIRVFVRAIDKFAVVNQIHLNNEHPVMGNVEQLSD